ncbi:hypothetical protein P7K49_030588, partial [Saguinus oedipus]
VCDVDREEEEDETEHSIGSVFQEHYVNTDNQEELLQGVVWVQEHRSFCLLLNLALPWVLAGFFTQISTLADVQENVMEYLHVLSRPKVIDQEHDVVWTEAYIDSTSLNSEMLTSFGTTQKIKGDISSFEFITVLTYPGPFQASITLRVIFLDLFVSSLVDVVGLGAGLVSAYCLTVS